MPKIDIETARAWARVHFPSPVKRRPIDDLLAHCPRVEGEITIRCKDCRAAEPIAPVYQERFGSDALYCVLFGAYVHPDDYCSSFDGLDGGINDENT